MRGACRYLAALVVGCTMFAACVPEVSRPTPAASLPTASPTSSTAPSAPTPSPTALPSITLAPATASPPPPPSTVPTPALFYAQLIYVAGFPIRGSAQVRPEAMTAAADQFALLVSGNAAVINRMRDAGVAVSVMADSEKLTDLPEYARLRGGVAPDGRSYDDLRGIGPSPCVAGEENVLHLLDDRYEGADILVHECAHAVLTYGLDARQRSVWNDIYNDSIVAGRWSGTYAATSASEFFAELTESYFGVNAVPRLGVHNDVNGAARLAAYDPAAFAFLRSVYTPGGTP